MQAEQSAYGGPERRRHRVLVTKNTEYHMRDSLCVGVRDTNTGDWRSGHAALGSELIGAIGPEITLGPGEPPRPGSRLFFAGDLLTSPLVRIRRPSRDTAVQYVPELAS